MSYYADDLHLKMVYSSLSKNIRSKLSTVLILSLYRSFVVLKKVVVVPFDTYQNSIVQKGKSEEGFSFS